jgi:hypothetical protein
MERTDLAELATRGRTLADAIREYQNTLEEAFDAALGEEDDDTGEEITPGNGDDFELLREAVDKAAKARFNLHEVIGILATQQGYRDFEDQGVEVG